MPGQQVKSSRPARPCQRYSLAFSSMPTRSICFCLPVTLATAGPAASVRRRSQLRSNTRGFWRPAQAHSWFVLYSPPRRWPLPILERLGHFPNAHVHFAVKLAPPTASQDAECRLGAPLSPPRPKPSPMVGHLVPAVHATQGAHSTTRHAADPSTVTIISFVNSHL